MHVLRIVSEAKADGLHLYFFTECKSKDSWLASNLSKMEGSIKIYQSKIGPVIAYEVQKIFESLYC